MAQDSLCPSNQYEDAFFENLGVRVLRSMRKIIHAVDVHSRKLNQRYGITAPQMMCLYSLARCDNQTLSELAKEVNLSMSTITGIVDRLEAKGLVTRIRSVEDRRRVHLAITRGGREVAISAPSLLQDRLSGALRGLPELEQATIAVSLERVVELMEADPVFPANDED